MTLDEIALKHDTDKSSHGHFYTRHYETIFDPIRIDVLSVLEVGIGGGQSLRMWRDYFCGATIYGVDQNPPFEIGDRINSYQCDQIDNENLRSQFQDKKLEIIVEDASHDPGKSIETLESLWPVLEPRGWYVIEDMDRTSFPEMIGRWYGKQPEQIRQLQMFNNRDRGCIIVFIQKW